MDEITGCVICREEVQYRQEAGNATCAVCSKEFQTNTKCKNEHFVCDGCHSLSANDLVEAHCRLENASINPVEQAIALMKSSRVKSNGPEHHFLFAAVLLNSYYNATNNQALKVDKIAIARKRAEVVPGGFCGFYGACGAGIASGIFVSIATGATPVSTGEWKLANTMTGRSLLKIAESGGPRCCKRDGFIAMTEAIRFALENLGITLETTDRIVCSFSANNKECLKAGCRFYPM